MEKIRPVIGTKSATRHILNTFGLHASKRFGQNFLVDPLVVADTVDAADIKDGERILEIGPGIGTLTQGLLEAGATVTAVEIDKKLPAVLNKTLEGYENFRLVEGDILKTDLRAVMGDAPFKVVANLPYYITTPILIELLSRNLPITQIVAMVQKEVALRIIADAGTKDYGSLSVIIKYHTTPRIVRFVPPASFLPPPEVESAVISCAVRREKPPVADEEIFFKLVRAAFGQRRKTLANALKGAGFDKEVVKAATFRAEIDGGRRGETLSIDEFLRLADAYCAAKKEK